MPLGIDPEQLIHNIQGRPHKLSDGRLVSNCFEGVIDRALSVS